MAVALAIDNFGNVYVTGYSYDSLSFLDYTTIKYDADGNLLWVNRYDGPGNGFDWGRCLAVDNNGNLYVTGTSEGLGTFYDFLTIKYNTSGEEIWVRRYNGSGDTADYVLASVVDNVGNIYVTGGSWEVGSYYDYATVKYDTNGNEVWIIKHNGSGNYWDVSYAIALDNYNNIYITGYSYYWSTSYDYITIKYIQSSDIREEKSIKGEKLFYKQHKKIYDITGRIIGKKKLKPGIYFPKTEKEIKKILILR